MDVVLFFGSYIAKDFLGRNLQRDARGMQIGPTKILYPMMVLIKVLCAVLNRIFSESDESIFFVTKVSKSLIPSI